MVTSLQASAFTSYGCNGIYGLCLKETRHLSVSNIMSLRSLIAVLLIWTSAPLYCSSTSSSLWRRDCVTAPGWLTKTVDDCKFTFRTYACRGECTSSTKPTNYSSGFASSCSCCAPIEYTIKLIENTCKGKGGKNFLRVAVPVRCACRPCS